MPDVLSRFQALADKIDPEQYNFKHFRATHLIADVRRTFTAEGIRPGQPAPDFELPRAGGGSLRLRELRGKPVLLRFGSFTSPATIGSVEPLKRLHERWGDQVEFVEVLIRQAHPGPDVPAYESLDQKIEDARRYQAEEGIPWTIVVDDVPGKAHQVYGKLADPVYLIDSAGKVALYSLWSNAAALNRAIERLLARGGRGVVGDGIERSPNLLAILANGWPGIRRGLPQSYLDLETALPGSGLLLWLGYVARPLFADRANRLDGRPEPAPARRPVSPAAVAAGAFAGAALALVLYRRLR